ncbi:hypothetical protein JRQ81_003392 [Phrynocephalus forsythii]|uniref:Myb/SANT-like DNA-binding domain-containing protein n=1 Tax=Phrynocephalus forsythii TaxID=171643 RepID=A0A9Q0XLM3_9SAUR|nr:hypothetical protein JRQ81_003392 [Phrynocephalus forsythii]
MQNGYATVALLGLPADEPELICKVEPEEEEPWIPHKQAARERRILPGSKSGAETPEVAISSYRQYRGTTWTYPEVIDLLVIWREREIQQELQRSHRNIETFQVVAGKMAQRGHQRSALECRSKIKTLKRDYRIAKTKNSPGKGHLAWLFYDQLDHLLENEGELPPLEKLPSLNRRRVAIVDSVSQCSTEEEEEEEATTDGLKEGGPAGQEVLGFRTSSPAQIKKGSILSLCIKQEAPDERPVMVPQEVSRLVPPLPSSHCDKPDRSASSGRLENDDAATSSPSPVPGPARSYAAERLASLRKRKRKNRQEMALEITQAADRRVQRATDRILTALGEYAQADLQDRERDRGDTEQIIALMNRQTELLESLVRKQAESQAPTASLLTGPAQIPRPGHPNHPAEPSPLRVGVTRCPLARARYRR